MEIPDAPGTETAPQTGMELDKVHSSLPQKSNVFRSREFEYSEQQGGTWTCTCMTMVDPSGDQWRLDYHRDPEAIEVFWLDERGRQMAVGLL